MSTIKVTNINNASASSGGIALDSSGHVQVDGLQMPTAGALSNRNKIINGDMRIDQRNAGASVTLSDDGAYTVDRWFIRNYGGTGRFSVQQDSASPNNADPSVKLTVTTTDTPGTSGYSFGQSVEGFNFSSLAYGTASAKTATVSFWVRSSVTGTYCLSVRNSVTNRSYVAEYSISAANTWEYKTITFAGDTAGTWLSTNGTGATLEWSLGSQTAKETTAGSWQAGNYVGTSNQTDWISTNGATFYLTGVQLEVGEKATPFEHRSYGDELARCQRYYEAYYLQSYAFVGNSYSSTQAIVPLHWNVQKRAIPTMTLPPVGINSGEVALTASNASYATTRGTHTLNGRSPSYGELSANSYGGLTSGGICMLYAAGTTCFLTLDAEL